MHLKHAWLSLSSNQPQTAVAADAEDTQLPRTTARPRGPHQGKTMLRSSLSVKIGVVAVITSAAAWQLHGTVSNKFAPGARSFAVAAACTDPVWSASTAYGGGQRVTHESKTYEAKW